ncbi:GNAT family N-acetyltransferase [Tenggerimyces flavus]|uniref:GNAT family N-acetyltransferase n=1 Tax=Tenggerimyces flavus TaxID=1708749 RepID=A0ABV7YNC0_9ACTN|nr:GNAT family N-acetyltransferase [Tenggerimyces flavus]MBM7786471.1 GNAT superfamily N-acetyltransferase [Tenggerimyces flavus]
MTAIEFRAGTLADVEAVTALVDAAYRHYIPRIGMTPRPMRADYDQVLRERNVVLAEREGELIGVLVMLEDPDEFVVENVAVHPDHHGRGLGGALLTLAETTAREAGHTEIRLYTHEKMTENRAIYAHRGYVEYEPKEPLAPVVVHLRKPLG